MPLKEQITQLSMWSGPRNISTAMMRSFGNRPDCVAVDEPFYAHYLAKTGLEHPMRAEILKSQPQQWQTVIKQLDKALPPEKSLLYLKHMTQHMLPEIDRAALLDHVHCFLIRDPRLVIASFAAKWDQIDANATGFHQQLELYHYYSRHSPTAPIIIEGEDIQKSSREILQKLCAACNIPFSDRMLSWERGKKPEDGVWGAHWYNSVENSTGFTAYKPKPINLTPEQEQLAKELDPVYQELKCLKLQI